MTLTVAVRPCHHDDAASGVDADSAAFKQTRAGAELTDKGGRRDAAGLNVGTDPKAPQLAVRLRRGAAGGEAGHVSNLDQLVHRAVIIAGVIGDGDRRLVRVRIRRDEVAAADLNRIDPHLTRSAVDDTLQLIGRFRPACAAIGVHWQRVGEHGLHIAVDQRRGVRARHQRAVQPGWNRRGEGGQICAHVGQRFRADRQELAVRIQRQFDLGLVIAALRVRDERL